MIERSRRRLAVAAMTTASLLWIPLSRATTTKAFMGFAQIDNRVFIQTTVDGKGPFLFLLDTGSSNTTLTTRLARDLALQTKASAVGHGAGEAPVGYSIVHVNSVAVADITLGQMDAPAIDYGRMPLLMGFDRFDGVIGAELFKGRIITIDPPRRQLTIEDSRTFRPPAGIQPIEFQLNDDGMPVVNAEVAGVQGRFEIDTGDRSSLTLFGPFWRAHGFTARLGQTFEALTGFGVGGSVRSIVGRPDRLKLRGLTIESPLTRLSLQRSGAFARADYAGSIGMGLLKNFVTILDYDSRRMWLARVPNTEPDHYDRSGAWLALDGHGGIQIADVVHGSPADQAGLRPGDSVASVAGVPGISTNLFAIRSLLSSPSMDSVNVSIRGRQPGDRNLALRDMTAPAKGND